MAKKAETNGTTAGAEQKGYVIPKLRLVTMEVPIVGTTSLITHRWSAKARRIMLDAQTGKARAKKEPKVPEEEYREALYTSTEGWHGVPSVAFKAACVGACRFVEGLPMTMARRLLYVIPDGRDREGVELTRVTGEHRMREDMVRLDNGSADIRFRPEFLEWSAVLRVRFIASAISDEQVMHLIDLAGTTEGICEWRPGSKESSTGTHGCWQVARD